MYVWCSQSTLKISGWSLKKKKINKKYPTYILHTLSPKKTNVIRPLIIVNDVNIETDKKLHLETRVEKNIKLFK